VCVMKIPKVRNKIGRCEGKETKQNSAALEHVATIINFTAKPSGYTHHSHPYCRLQVDFLSWPSQNGWNVQEGYRRTDSPAPVHPSSVFPDHDINCTSRTYLPTRLCFSSSRTTPLGQQTKHHDGPRRLLAMAHTLLCKSVDGAGATRGQCSRRRGGLHPPGPTDVCEAPHEKEVSGKGLKGTRHLELYRSHEIPKIRIRHGSASLLSDCRSDACFESYESFCSGVRRSWATRPTSVATSRDTSLCNTHTQKLIASNHEQQSCLSLQTCLIGRCCCWQIMPCC
jgi:hypothetical protein